MAADEKEVALKGDGDYFNGVTVRPRHYGDTTPDEFHHRLSVSLEVWKVEGKRGVWVKIPLTQAELVPVAAKLGFQFHHSQPDYVMMTKWLPTDEVSHLPRYGNHQIGVAGFVVNDKNEVLLIQEKWIRNLKMIHWKLPGGLSDPGENLADTAIRETFEETGIKTEFVAVLSFRHMHQFRWGTSDLYFACYLRPLTSEITICPTEVAAAKWMDVDAYIAEPETMPTNRMIAEAYRDGVKRGSFVQPTVYPHFLTHKPDLVMYRDLPIVRQGSHDPTQTDSGDSRSADISKSTRANM